MRLFVQDVNLFKGWNVVLAEHFCSDNDANESYVEMSRQLWRETREKGSSQRYLRCPGVCASQWIISDKVIKPPIQMLVGAFNNLTSPLPASSPFGEVVNTVVGVTAWFIFKYIPNPSN